MRPLPSREKGQPFFYWFGSPHPHRGYPQGHDPAKMKPADIAHAVAYLASPHAGYVTGQELHVNGGMHM